MQDQDQARLCYKEEEYTLPIVRGADGQEALDISQLHKRTGLYAYDPRLSNTAISKSKITRIDPEESKLYYRGYELGDLIEHSHFVELAYLLIQGALPNLQEYEKYSLSLCSHSMVHEAMRNFFDAFPVDAHPLAILATMVTALSSYYPSTYEEHISKGIDIKVRLLSKVRTLAAWSYKKSIGHPIIYPRDELGYCANFLHMIFALPTQTYNIAPELLRLLDQLLMLYSDHEQNIATSTVRLVGSSRANLFVCINAGICALWGARESGWGFYTMSMLRRMRREKMKPADFFASLIREENVHSPAFGHKKYKKMDARAQIAKKLLERYLEKNPAVREKELVDKGLEVEEFILRNDYCKQRNLAPNLDFYSALLFHIIGIPESMYNVVRVIGKLPGWLAHWEEQKRAFLQPSSSMRPQQIYTGVQLRPYVDIKNR